MEADGRSKKMSHNQQPYSVAGEHAQRALIQPRPQVSKTHQDTCACQQMVKTQILFLFQCCSSCNRFKNSFKSKFLHHHLRKFTARVHNHAAACQEYGSIGLRDYTDGISRCEYSRLLAASYSLPSATPAHLPLCTYEKWVGSDGSFEFPIKLESKATE